MDSVILQYIVDNQKVFKDKFTKIFPKQVDFEIEKILCNTSDVGLNGGGMVEVLHFLMFCIIVFATYFKNK